MVPRSGIEPACRVLQTRAITRLAPETKLGWLTSIDLVSSDSQPGALPLSYSHQLLSNYEELNIIKDHFKTSAGQDLNLQSSSNLEAPDFTPDGDINPALYH